MPDQFRKVAKKRERPSKRARDPQSGKFEEVNPLNDPDLLNQCVRWVRAAEDLAPLLSALAQREGDSQEDRFARTGGTFLAAFLFALRATLLDQMAFDPVKTREAKNPPLLAPREAMMLQAMKRGAK